MKGPWIPDTNTILRYLLDDHPELSAKARVFWESVRESRLSAVLTEGVLMEAVYVLSKFYKVPRIEAVERLSGLLRYAGLSQEPAGIFPDALALFGQGGLDFVDCLLVVRERTGRGAVFTFDRPLVRTLSPG